MVNNKDLAHVANIKSIEHLVLMLLLAFNILVKIHISTLLHTISGRVYNVHTSFHFNQLLSKDFNL